MANLGSLFYSVFLKDMTDADFQKINRKFKDLGYDIKLTPKILKDVTQASVPKGVKIELDPLIKNEALQKAAEGKVMNVAVAPLLKGFREAIVKATKENPPLAEVGVQEVKLREIINRVLNKHGFMINISTVNDNYSKTIQQKLNGGKYTVTIHADSKEITRSVQASLMQLQSRYFGLQVSRDILRDSIDRALMGKPFPIQIAVMHDQARRAVQNALNNARMVGKDDALAFQRLQTGELKAAQAELARLKAEHMGAASAAKAHATASVNLGGALGRNITIAGELSSAMVSLYSIHAAKEFLSQVVEIGGELEHQKIALETIYGSGSKMESLYGQIKGLARESPFGVMELTKNVKQLSAYGVAYNEVYDTAKRLADISAATSVDIQRLILAYGKTKNRTFLDGLEAKQFAYANIPIYDALSKKLTELEGKFVSVKDVMDRIKKKEIGFDMVKDILWDMTDEGGKFYNMQEKLAGSVKTSWKLVRDNIELMFGDIAEGSIGSGLKSVAEILQGLTREWKTLEAVVLSGAGVFGIYKVAVLASNVALGQTTAANLTQRLSQVRLTASLAQTAIAYRGMNVVERESIVLKGALEKALSKNIFKTNALTSSEIKALVASKSLTRDSAARLIALGKISPMQARYLLNQKLIAIGDLRMAVSARKHGASLNILGKEVKIASFRFKLLASSIWSSVKAMGSMVFNPATLGMAAIGGLAALWQKNNEEMQKAKEIGDGIFDKANDGAKELKETLKDMKSSEGLSDVELSQGIEKLKNSIKDFSLNPIKDINESLYDQNGLLLPLQKQYDNLLEKLKKLKEEFDLISDRGIGESVGRAISASNGGWWDDDVNTDAKDFDKALKDREQKIQEYVAKYEKEVQRAVDEAAKTDLTYAESIKGMDNYAQKFAELVKNQEKYATGFYYASRKVEHSLKDIFDISKFKGAWGELTKEMDEVWQNLNADAKIKGFIGDSQSIKDATEEVKESYALSIAEWIKGLEVSDDLKLKMRWYYGELLGIDMQAMDWEAQWSEAIEKQLGQNNPDLLKKIKSGATLSDAEKKEVLDYVYNSYRALYDKLPEELKKSFNDAVTKTDGNGNVSLDYGKGFKLITRMYLLADEEQWKQEIDKATGNLPEIQAWLKGATDTASFFKAVREGYKTAREGLDELQSRTPLELKASMSFNIKNLKAIPLVSKAFANASPEVQKWITEWNAFVDALNAATKVGDKYSGDIESEYNKSHKSKKGGSKGGSKKDPFAEAVKERIKILKEAKKEYEDLVKTMGPDAAYNQMKDSPIFAGLKANQYLPEQPIPKTIEDYRNALDLLQEKLASKGLKTKEHRELNIEIEKLKFEINKKETENAIKLALDKISKEAEKQVADWNLFDKIRKATGNQDLAVSIAFGLNADAEMDYPKLIEKQLDKQAKIYEDALIKRTKGTNKEYSAKGYTFQSLKTLYDKSIAPGAGDEDVQAWLNVPEEIRKAWEKANGDILKYFDQQKDSLEGILSEYQSLSEKLAKIDFDRDEKIKTVKGSDMSEGDKAKYIQRINVEADYQKFQQSADYMKFFSGIYSLTMSQAQEIGDKIRLHLDQRLQAGKISAEEYYKEIERINQQLDKLRNVKSDAMTFMTSGVKGLQSKKLDMANSDVLSQMTKVEEAEEALAKARAEGNEKEIMAAEVSLGLARRSLKSYEAIRDAIVKDQRAWQNVADVANLANNISKGVSDSFNTLRDLADSFGFDTDSGAWNTSASVIDTLTTVTGGVQKTIQSLMSGDIGGAISGGFDTLLTPITIWNELHDKKLQRDIEDSKKRYDQYDRLLTQIERRLANHLGGYNAFDPVPGTDYGEDGAFGYQREMKKAQLEELQRQQADMEAMKKKDPEAITELRSQISELTDEIANLEIEAANAIYGIDIAGWAQTIVDALWDACMKGEDVLEAFDKAVASIMDDVVKDILRVNILERAFQSTRDWLASEDGPMNDGVLDMDEAREMWSRIQEDSKKGMDNWNTAMETMPEDLMHFLKDIYDQDS